MTRAYVIAWIDRTTGQIGHIGIYGERWPTGDLSFFPAELFSVERSTYENAATRLRQTLKESCPELIRFMERK